MIIKKLIAGLMAALTLGCAGGVPFFSGDPTVEQSLAKLAIQQATLRAIQSKGPEAAPARAKAVVDIIDQAQAVLANDDSGDGTADHTVTSAELAAAINQFLPADLSVADKALVAQLSALVIAEVSASIPVDQQKLPVAEVSAVLGWVKEAAVLAIPVG